MKTRFNMNKDIPDKSAEAINGDQAEENNGTPKVKPRRRLQDGITSKTPTRKMDLDRRNGERRSMHETDYKGPSRRYTIDRRVGVKDRRKSDD